MVSLVPMELRMKNFPRLRCPTCGDVTEHRLRCAICSHPLPELRVAWGKCAILLVLASLLVLLI
jgi:hypothetical protein